MKKIITAVIILLVITMAGTSASAQLNISVNIDRQPVWGPAGYDNVSYYYLPEADAYYSVSKKKYVYQQGNTWVFRNSLPARYRNIDMYKTYKVVVTGDKPYLQHRQHQQEYSTYKTRHDQLVIRDAKEEKYYSNKNHPEHKNWEAQQKKKNNNGNHH